MVQPAENGFSGQPLRERPSGTPFDVDADRKPGFPAAPSPSQLTVGLLSRQGRGELLQGAKVFQHLNQQKWPVQHRPSQPTDSLCVGTWAVRKGESPSHQRGCRFSLLGLGAGGGSKLVRAGSSACGTLRQHNYNYQFISEWSTGITPASACGTLRQVGYQGFIGSRLRTSRPQTETPERCAPTATPLFPKVIFPGLCGNPPWF